MGNQPSLGAPTADPKESQYTAYTPALSYTNRTYATPSLAQGTALSQEQCLARCFQTLCGGYVTYNPGTRQCAFRTVPPNPQDVKVALYSGTGGTAYHDAITNCVRGFERCYQQTGGDEDGCTPPYQACVAQAEALAPNPLILETNLTGGGVTCSGGSAGIPCLQRHRQFTNDFFLDNPRANTCSHCNFSPEAGTQFLVGVNQPTAKAVIQPDIPFEEVSIRDQFDGAIVVFESKGRYATTALDGFVDWVETFNYSGYTPLDVATKFKIVFRTADTFNIYPLFDTTRYLHYATNRNAISTNPSQYGETDSASLFRFETEGMPARIVRIGAASPNIAGAFMTGGDPGQAQPPLYMAGQGVPGRTGGFIPRIVELSPYVRVWQTVKVEDCCFGTFPKDSLEAQVCAKRGLIPESGPCLGVAGETGVINDYCRVNFEADPRCQTFCKDPRHDCDLLIESYCRRLGPDTAAQKDFCGCFRGTDFYNRFFESLKARVSLSSTLPDFPQCYYPPCAASSIQNYRTKSLGSQCPNIMNCINITEINNVTGEIGSIKVSGDIKCQAITENITPTPGPPQVAITAVTPNWGPPTGGTNVVITGVNFQIGATVLFGSQQGRQVNVQNGGQITAVSPPGTGTVAISVSNPGGTSALFQNAFAYSTTPTPPVDNPKPTIISLNPNGGVDEGGELVTVTGTGFVGGSKVLFGGTEGNTQFITATQLRVTTPPQPSGQKATVDVTVRNPDGQVATLPGGFTYRAVTPTPPRRGFPIWGWILIAVAILLVIGGIVYGVRRSRTRQKMTQPLFGQPSSPNFQTGTS